MDANNEAALRELSHRHAVESWDFLQARLPGIRMKPTEKPSLLTTSIPVGDRFLTRNVSKDILLDPKKTRDFFADALDEREEYEAQLIAYEEVDNVLFGKIGD